jgi:chemotaxis protein methyltransferase CheR
MRHLSVDDFNFLARLLHRRSGLILTQDKSGLFDRRIKPVLYRFGLKDIHQLVGELRLGNEAVAAALAEAITINDTSFFRDPAQFEALRDLLPQLLERRGATRRLRVWSAASSTGQEAYSLAMLLDEMELAARGWTIDLVATDISTDAIGRAARGHYSAFEVQRGLGKDRLARHFVGDKAGFTACEKLRRMVTFRRFNLLDSYGWLDDLDLVLCRNVLIYFDRATKLDVLERIADCMGENAILMLGDAEAPHAFNPAFQSLPGRDTIYVKARAALRAAV